MWGGVERSTRDVQYRPYEIVDDIGVSSCEGNYDTSGSLCDFLFSKTSSENVNSRGSTRT